MEAVWKLSLENNECNLKAFDIIIDLEKGLSDLASKL